MNDSNEEIQLDFETQADVTRSPKQEYQCPIEKDLFRVFSTEVEGLQESISGSKDSNDWHILWWFRKNQWKKKNQFSSPTIIMEQRRGIHGVCDGFLRRQYISIASTDALFLSVIDQICQPASPVRRSFETLVRDAGWGTRTRNAFSLFNVFLTPFLTNPINVCYTLGGSWQLIVTDLRQSQEPAQ